MQEGVIAGGGSALLYAAKILDNVKGTNEDQNSGITIVKKALQAPIRQIAENAGFDGAVVANEVSIKSDKDYGFNAQTGKYVNMFEDGVIDPVKVVRSALQDATSIASLLITTEVAIVDAKTEDSGAGAAGMPPMGGMGGMPGMGGF